ncbi:unnamed protein product [Owenia fusiformis]|uniref:Uncharacterized protein n=1 Tax=Owenia fusiformis TaxID=6347 RepID=A0A8S4QA28_OWEFU|nr:unnamed protein product [Owenia fusiformis]
MSVAHKDTLTPAESEISLLKWGIHFEICCQIADQHRDLDRKPSIIVIDGRTDKGIKNSIITKVVQNPVDNYEPDVVQHYIDSEGRITRDPLLNKRSESENQMLEICVSYGRLSNSLDLAYQRKAERLENLNIYHRVGIVAVSLESASIHHESLKHLEDLQQRMIIDYLVNLRNKMDEHTRLQLEVMMESSQLPTLWENKPFFFSREYEKNFNDKGLNDLTEYAFAQGNICPAVVKEKWPDLVHCDGSSIEVGEPATMNTVCPAGIAGMTFERSGKTLWSSCGKRLLDIVMESESNHYLMRAVRDSLLLLESKDWKVVANEAFTENMKFLFGVNQREYAHSSRPLGKGHMRKVSALDPKVWKHQDNTAPIKGVNTKVPILLERMTRFNSLASKVKMSEQSYNRFDHLCKDTSTSLAEMIENRDFLTTISWLEEAATVVKVMLLNNYDGVSIAPVMLDSFISGWVIKGPAHPREQTDRIPIVYIQVLKQGGIAWDKASGSAHHNLALLTASETVLFMMDNNSELENTLGNIKRLVYMLDGYEKGFKPFLLEGGNPEEKVNEGLRII